MKFPHVALPVAVSITAPLIMTVGIGRHGRCGHQRGEGQYPAFHLGILHFVLLVGWR
jgi:hypothetical protein